MAQAAAISTSRRAASAIDGVGALAAKFDRLAVLGNALWGAWDTVNPVLGRKIDAVGEQMDDILEQIASLSGNDVATLKLKAKALKHLGYIEDKDDGGISHKIAASLLRSLA